MKKAMCALAAATFYASGAAAQIATDGTVGPRQSFQGFTVTIPSTVGRYVNGNLFHSFQVFNVGGAQTVTFQATPITLETPSMSNIVGRVTGGTPSLIQGIVRSSTPGVNLYLINPSGIVFGAGALVDVNGSFYASSAHYLRSADGTKFESRGPGISLTFTTPDGFGFDSGTTAPIALQGGVLRAREGATVALVGGRILAGGAATASTMQAVGGNAVIVAVASPGVVEYGAGGVNLVGFDAMADVQLQRGTAVNVNEGVARTGGGSVFVRGADVSIDQASIAARTLFGPGRAIDLGASGDLTISKSNVIAVTNGAGNAGRIRLAGTNIVLSNGTLVDTSCDPGCTTGNGGLIEVKAGDLFLIDGTQTVTALVSNSFGGGRTGEIDLTAGRLVLDGDARIQGNTTRAGNGTEIRLHTGDIVMRNGGQVEASARGAGRSGRIVVDNSGAIRLEGTRRDPVVAQLIAPSGFFSNAWSTGDAGSIVISTRTLEILRGGEISSSARFRSTGQGGSIAVAASESIRIAGTDDNSKRSGILTNTQTSGDAGRIALSAPTIEILDGAAVQSVSEGAGRAGEIQLTGRNLSLLGNNSYVSTDASSTGDAGAVRIDLTGTLAADGGSSGVFAQTTGSGRGGSIHVNAQRIDLSHSAGIFAGTQDTGAGGQIAVHATDTIRMDSNSRISTRTIEAGSAGTVDVRADRGITIGAGAQINSSTIRSGNAGSVFVQAGDGITISAGSVASSSLKGGNAGNVEVRAGGLIDLRDQGQITTSTVESGHAGTVAVFAGRGIEMQSGAAIVSETQGAGRAGSVDVRSEGVVSVRDGARVSTSSHGAGDAGTVTLYGRDGVSVASDGRIASESTGSGLAGNLDVRSSGTLQVTDGGAITTSATFSDGGNIRIEAPLGFMDNGRITTAVGTGGGDGGNMEILIRTFALNHSTISANAFGGDGGNIHIGSETLIKSADSSITASSQLGIDGTITFSSPAIDPTGQLLPPAPSFLDAGAVLAGRCGARLAGRASSLVIVPHGTGGQPGDLHTSFEQSLRYPWQTRNDPACELPQSPSS